MKKIGMSPENQDAYLEIYEPIGGGPHPAVLIYPGGGYRMLSDAEHQPVVDFFRKRGYQPFVLMYSINDEAHYPAPLLEGSRAVWEIRKNAEEYGVNPDQITLVGFSAGAHAATMLATLWQDDASREGTDIPFGGNRPNATVTGYTPTTFEDFFQKPKEIIEQAGGGGPQNLLGEPGTRWADYASLTSHRFVSKDTPPAFLWKTSSDFPGFSTIYAKACKDAGVECELHIFSDPERCAVQKGLDGYAEENDLCNTRLWGEMAVNWLRNLYR